MGRCVPFTGSSSQSLAVPILSQDSPPPSLPLCLSPFLLLSLSLSLCTAEDSVASFLDCLEQHARDRGLSPNSSSYWIAATALNQWTIGGDWMSDALPEEGEGVDMLERHPLRAKFFLALQACVGTICIVDRAATSFSRLWVCYETHLAMGMDSHKLDIYTPVRAEYENGHGHRVSTTAAGLLDGPGVVRAAGIVSLPVLQAGGRSVSRGGQGLLSRGSGGNAAVVAGAVVVSAATTTTSAAITPENIFDKALRESHFPWSLVEALLDVSLEDAHVSVPSDYWRLCVATGGQMARVRYT